MAETGIIPEEAKRVAAEETLAEEEPAEVVSPKAQIKDLLENQGDLEGALAILAQHMPNIAQGYAVKVEAANELSGDQRTSERDFLAFEIARAAKNIPQR